MYSLSQFTLFNENKNRLLFKQATPRFYFNSFFLKPIVQKQIYEKNTTNTFNPELQKYGMNIIALENAANNQRIPR